MRHNRSLAAALFAVLVVAALPVRAVDGVIEINQKRALDGGVTASDTPGFPVTIDTSGSYRLTGNLTVDHKTTAIQVTAAAAQVDIDLNGFSILGPTTCTAPPTVTCSPLGDGRGIDRLGVADSWLRVSHGTVRGMGDRGVAAVGSTLVVDGVEATYNGVDGIVGGDNSQITHAVVARNGRYGIIVGASAAVRDSVVTLSGKAGLIVGSSSLVASNQVTSNVGAGINAGRGCTITGNTSSFNVSGLVAGAGIFVDLGSSVFDNTARGNTVWGIWFGATGGYGRNVLSGNNGGDANAQVFGPALELATNVCGFDTICP